MTCTEWEGQTSQEKLLAWIVLRYEEYYLRKGQNKKEEIVEHYVSWTKSRNEHESNKDNDDL